MATSTTENQELPTLPELKTDWAFLQLPTVDTEEYLAATDEALAVMGKEVIEIMHDYVEAIPALAAMSPQEVAKIVHALAVWGLNRRHEGIEAGRDLQQRLYNRSGYSWKLTKRSSQTEAPGRQIMPSGLTLNQETRKAGKARQDEQAREREVEIRNQLEAWEAQTREAASAHEAELQKLADVPVLTDEQMWERIRRMERGEALAPL